MLIEAIVPVQQTIDFQDVAVGIRAFLSVNSGPGRSIEAWPPENLLPVPSKQRTIFADKHHQLVRAVQRA